MTFLRSFLKSASSLVNYLVAQTSVQTRIYQCYIVSRAEEQDGGKGISEEEKYATDMKNGRGDGEKEQCKSVEVSFQIMTLRTCLYKWSGLGLFQLLGPSGSVT
jgi:hypothetical protein